MATGRFATTEAKATFMGTLALLMTGPSALTIQSVFLAPNSPFSDISLTTSFLFLSMGVCSLALPFMLPIILGTISQLETLHFEAAQPAWWAGIRYALLIALATPCCMSALSLLFTLGGTFGPSLTFVANAFISAVPPAVFFGAILGHWLFLAQRLEGGDMAQLPDA